MEKVLIGAGGFSKEVMCYIGKLKRFVDDEYYIKNSDNIFPLSEFDNSKYEAMVVIGDSIKRKEIINKLPKNTKFFTYIHPFSFIGSDVTIGEGSIICPGTVITTNIKIGNHSQLNLNTTIGHDTIIGDFFTTAPGVHISGNCLIKDCVYFGTNSSVKEKIKITDNVIVGLNAGVVKNIDESGVYGGTPAKLIKKI